MKATTAEDMSMATSGESVLVATVPTPAPPRASKPQPSTQRDLDDEVVMALREDQDITHENAQLKRQLVEKELENDILKAKVALKQTLMGPDASLDRGGEA